MKSSSILFLPLLLNSLFCITHVIVKGQVTVRVTDVSKCNNQRGTAVVNTPSAGNLELEYTLNSDFVYQASNVFTNLEPGSYTAKVRVKNAGCIYSADFEVRDESPLNVGISGTGTFNICDRAPAEAVLSASASGGSGDYDFSWPGQTITVRSSGKFSVNVTDRKTGCSKTEEGEVIFIPVLCAMDPNDIIGPVGYGPKKMIAKSEEHAYIIHFENDPVFATAPAQVVTIRQPLDKNVNIFSLRLADFGFAGFTFHVPPNSTFYKGNLNLTSSLGVNVEVTAGVDATRREAFWIFESKDPNTGLAPTNASQGFLPINDSSAKGEGFVGFTIKAADGAQTGDTIHAKADIVFDVNVAIPTPEINNIVDAVAPTSQLLLVSVSQNIISLSWTAEDDPGGSGLKDFGLYVSKDGSPFELYQRFVATGTSFTGTPGSSYCFYISASDNVNNQEPPPTNKCTVAVDLADGTLPLTWLYFKGQKKTDDIELSWATGSEINTAYFVVERSTDGRSFQEIGKVAAAGNSSQANSYTFLDKNALVRNTQKIFYRLRQVDKDGKFTYSNVITFVVRNRNGQLVKVYPNPFTKHITVEISTSAQAAAGDRLELYSVNGVLLYRKNLANRQNNVPLVLQDLPTLAPGTYIINTNLSGVKGSLKIVKQ